MRHDVECNYHKEAAHRLAIAVCQLEDMLRPKDYQPRTPFAARVRRKLDSAIAASKQNLRKQGG